MSTPENTNETWKPIEGHPMYEVSDHGRVRSLHGRRGEHHIRALGRHRQGYGLAVLSSGGKQTVLHVHRLVAKAFLPNPHGLPVVHHKDANPGNNHVSNLEWTTQKENIRQAMLVRGNWLKVAMAGKVKKQPITLIRPDKSRQSFASLRDAATYLDSLAVDCGEVLGFASGQGSTKSPHSLRREGLLLMITLRAGESCYSPGPLRSRCRQSELAGIN